MCWIVWSSLGGVRGIGARWDRWGPSGATTAASEGRTQRLSTASDSATQRGDSASERRRSETKASLGSAVSAVRGWTRAVATPAPPLPLPHHHPFYSSLPSL